MATAAEKTASNAEDQAQPGIVRRTLGMLGAVRNLPAWAKARPLEAAGARGRPHARGALERARATIERLPQDSDFRKTTRYDRAGWIDLLDWLIAQYAKKQGRA